MLVKYRISGEHQEHQSVFTADGRCVDIGNIDVITSWNNYLLYVKGNNEYVNDDESDVFCLDLDSEKARLLKSYMDVYEATMDGNMAIYLRTLVWGQNRLLENCI